MKAIKRKYPGTLICALLVSLGYAGFNYAYPKLTLFEPNRIDDNFRQMTRIFPFNTLEKSPTPLVLTSQRQAIDLSYNFQGQIQRVSDFLQRSHTTGFLVIQDNQIIHEQYFKQYVPTDTPTSFSVAKSFVATLIGIAWDEGRIRSLQDDIAQYAPSLAQSGFNGVSIEDALQMASGIEFSEVYNDTTTDAYRIYDKLYLLMRPIESVTSDYPRRHKPGTRFHYASINTQALALVLTHIYQRPVSAILEEKLWHPLGAEADAQWLADLYGNPVAFWGVNAILRDYAKLGLLYLNGGKLNGKQIVSKQWVDLATHPSKPFLQPGQIDQDWGYQYHWWIPKDSLGEFSAIGIWGQFIYVNPKANMVIVKTSADPEFKRHEFEAMVAFRAIAEMRQSQ